MLKQLLNGNNGLLLILTLNNTDLSLTCQCWVFLWLWRSVIVIFQSQLKYLISKWNSVGIFKIQEKKSWILKKNCLKLIKSGFSMYGSICVQCGTRPLASAVSGCASGVQDIARRDDSATNDCNRRRVRPFLRLHCSLELRRFARTSRGEAEFSMGWVNPWVEVGLGRVEIFQVLVGWVGSTIAKLFKTWKDYLNALKARLDKIWLHQAVKFDFTADLTGTENR